MRVCSGWVAVLVAAGVAACGAGENPAGGAWQAVHDTIGDTLVVRTVSGSVWGEPAELLSEVRIGAFEGEDVYLLGDVGGLAVDREGSIYIYDSQVPALRKYAPDGTFVATFGRKGGGPGEYENSDGGLAVLPDGRVVLRDPGNARMQVYSAEGEPLDTWPIRGGYYTSTPLYMDTAGRVYHRIWGAEVDGDALVVFTPDGETADTLAIPDWDYDAPTVSAQTEGTSQTWGVPFSPHANWGFSPYGYFVGGVSTRYALDVMRPGQPVLRIERVAAPVAVSDGERTYQEDRVRRAMQRLVPGWRWNGPAIPDTKPPFRDILVDRDGRIWVRVAQPGREPPAEEGIGDGGEAPEWEEPIVFDVFEPGGRYLGRVATPDGFSASPEPVIRGEHIWAVVRDALGVQYVVRFRIVHGEGPEHELAG